VEWVEVNAFAVMMKGPILSGRRGFDIVCECWYWRHLDRRERQQRVRSSFKTKIRPA